MSTQERKVFYSMGEVAEMFDVNPSLIRFWEKKFDILKPHKNKKGNRMFTPADVENLRMIYHLSKEQGMKLDAVERRLRHNPDEVKGRAEALERLYAIRALLLEVRQELKLGGEVLGDGALVDEGEVEEVELRKEVEVPQPVEAALQVQPTEVLPVLQPETPAEEISAPELPQSADAPLPRIVEQTLF